MPTNKKQVKVTMSADEIRAVRKYGAALDITELAGIIRHVLREMIQDMPHETRRGNFSADNQPGRDNAQ